MTEIQYICVGDISPHPNNPRKDLGDLSELAESVKANGILQNLTVVPNYAPGGYRLFLGTYTVIIGHRRLAAAKLAGLETVPCAVVEMTESEQISAMLTENMQRNDLTVYEQAQGFQMMLDLGDTVEDIAEKSGFSASTVRRRVKLLRLDPDKFKESESRGATLADYMELDKLESPELKNKVLETIGTANFQNELKRAIDEEEWDKRRAAYIAGAEAFAQRVEQTPPDANFINQYSKWDTNKSTIERPQDADTVKYYFMEQSYGISLYREKTNTIQNVETDEQRQRREATAAAERKKAELKEISKRHFLLREEFVSNLSGLDRHKDKIMRFALGVLLDEDRGNGSAYIPLVTECLGIEDKLDLENCPLRDAVEVITALAEADGNELRYLLCAAYAAMEEEDAGYWEHSWNRELGYYDYCHCTNDTLDRVYDFLESLGYEVSDEEKAMRDGTHEVFGDS